MTESRFRPFYDALLIKFAIRRMSQNQVSYLFLISQVNRLHLSSVWLRTVESKLHGLKVTSHLLSCAIFVSYCDISSKSWPCHTSKCNMPRVNPSFQKLYLFRERCTWIVTLFGIFHYVKMCAMVDALKPLLFKEPWKTVVQLCLKSNSWSVGKKKLKCRIPLQDQELWTGG